MRFRTLPVLAVAVATAFGAVACGDDGDTMTSTAAAGATTEAMTTAMADGSTQPMSTMDDHSMNDMGTDTGVTADAAPTSDTAAAKLRSDLNALLQEHVYLAAIATGEALGGREATFKAAAGALDQNGVDLADMLASVYGPEAKEGFLGPWRAHIGFVVDYTTGVATKDMAKQDQAVADLQAYTTSFGAVLAGLNENLPRETVAELLGEHVVTLKAVVDAQAAGDAAKAYEAVRTAAGHMHMLGDPLAEATVQKFPEAFAG